MQEEEKLDFEPNIFQRLSEKKAMIIKEDF